MNKTSIEWTDFTSNPLKFKDGNGKVVWGCVKVSPGCTHCYSEALALRYNRGKLFNARTMEQLTPFLCQEELHKILTAKTVLGVEVSGKRCFIGDMTDIFGEWVTDEMLDQIFLILGMRRDVTFQVLTKRASRMWTYVSSKGPPWPLPNVWFGVSAEDQVRANRLMYLLRTPAVVRFASFEPLLGPITVFNKGSLYPSHNPTGERVSSGCLDWAIVGGESGPGARPCDLAWVRDLVGQMKESKTPCFVKQMGSRPAGMREWCDRCNTQTKSIMHGLDCDRSPVLANKKGNDPAEWPEDIRVREFPEAKP